MQTNLSYVISMGRTNNWFANVKLEMSWIAQGSSLIYICSEGIVYCGTFGLELFGYKSKF